MGTCHNECLVVDLLCDYCWKPCVSRFWRALHKLHGMRYNTCTNRVTIPA